MIFSHVFCDWHPPAEIMVYNVHAINVYKNVLFYYLYSNSILSTISENENIKGPSFPTFLGASA
jgi:hypothetical protein